MLSCTSTVSITESLNLMAVVKGLVRATHDYGEASAVPIALHGSLLYSKDLTSICCPNEFDWLLSLILYVRTSDHSCLSQCLSNSFFDYCL